MRVHRHNGFQQIYQKSSTELRIPYKKKSDSLKILYKKVTNTKAFLCIQNIETAVRSL